MRVVLVVVAAVVLGIVAWLAWSEADASLPEPSAATEKTATPTGPVLDPATPIAVAAPTPPAAAEPIVPRIATNNEHPEVPPLPANAYIINNNFIHEIRGTLRYRLQ